MKLFIKTFLLYLIPAFTMAQKDPTGGYITDKQADSLKRSLIGDGLRVGDKRRRKFNI